MNAFTAWFTNAVRSARNSTRFTQLARINRSANAITVRVLPAPVAITTNVSAAVTGQLVFDAADLLALTENDSAVVYVTLDKGGVVLDSYTYSVQVTSNQMQGISTMLMALLLGPVITLVILAAMTGWIGDLLNGLGKSLGGMGGSGKRSRK